MPTENIYRIPYPEQRALGELMHAHVDTHQGNLRAMVAFGDLLTNGDTFDIDLLEVVIGWSGPRLLTFSGSADLPLRGQLRLYVLTPEEFERPGSVADLDMRRWITDLVARVRQGYQVVLQSPGGYAREVLEGAGGAAQFAPPGTPPAELDDPRKLSLRTP
jgi:hypothetical protein